MCKILRKTNISQPLTRIRKCAYQGVRYVSFFARFCICTKGMNLIVSVTDQQKMVTINQPLQTDVN